MARTYGRFLYTIAYRLTGDPDDAQDLVQETLLRVRKGLPEPVRQSIVRAIGRAEHLLKKIAQPALIALDQFRECRAVALISQS